MQRMHSLRIIPSASLMTSKYCLISNMWTLRTLNHRVALSLRLIWALWHRSLIVIQLRRIKWRNLGRLPKRTPPLKWNPNRNRGRRRSPKSTSLRATLTIKQRSKIRMSKPMLQDLPLKQNGLASPWKAPVEGRSHQMYKTLERMITKLTQFSACQRQMPWSRIHQTRTFPPWKSIKLRNQKH